MVCSKGALNLKRKKRAAQRQRQRDDLGQEVRPDKKLKKKVRGACVNDDVGRH